MVEERIYTLMNKNHAVGDFLYDLDIHAFTKVLDIHDSKYAPLGIFDGQGNITKRGINEWWRGRAIPASRDQINALLSELNLDSTLELAEKNFGLSLSDRYWFNDSSNPQNWDDVNFFDNDFTDDLGLLTLGQRSDTMPSSLMSPNSTVGGDLRKKWMIVNGERFLIKSGYGITRQEVYNEVIATLLHERMLPEGEFVPYSIHKEDNGGTFSACPNMLREDEELVTAWDVIRNKKKPNNLSDYQFLVACFQELGLVDVEKTLAKMFTCDFILANRDRHYNNFGVIRNVETLEYTRMAPIFDTGNSLWCWQETLQSPIDFEYMAKPFKPQGMKPREQLKLFQEFDWFKAGRLDGFIDEAMGILSQNENMPAARLHAIERGLAQNVQDAISYVEREGRALGKKQQHVMKSWGKPERKAPAAAADPRSDQKMATKSARAQAKSAQGRSQRRN